MFRYIDTINKYLRDMKSPIVLEIGVSEGKNARLLLLFLHKEQELLIGIVPEEPFYGLLKNVV